MWCISHIYYLLLLELLLEYLVNIRVNLYNHISLSLPWLLRSPSTSKDDISIAFELNMYPEYHHVMSHVWKQPGLPQLLSDIASKANELNHSDQIHALMSIRCIMLNWYHPAITSIYSTMLTHVGDFTLDNFGEVSILARVMRDYKLQRLLLLIVLFCLFYVLNYI